MVSTPFVTDAGTGELVVVDLRAAGS